ncbi:UDP-galactopyranose mutase [Pelosinus sp. sgz500959]|uniref:UDP-galactopyranose mutase n=1 Tax=Pelosinus sp. sgz500959 TaxID=3242472 RepID=UPI0036733138
MGECNYDYIIVGSGLFGSVFAHQMTQRGKKCLIMEKRSHSGGNLYCTDVQGIKVHRYGAHIFHTSNRKVWDYVNSLVQFYPFINSPLARYKDKLYNLPFNMNTFYQIWGVITPEEAKGKLDNQRSQYINIKPHNLEEQALQLVGDDLYNKLIKGYTEKQWGCSAKELPAFIIKRLPVRFTFDNNYFQDTFQGIPIEGYNAMIDRLLENVPIMLGVDFLKVREEWGKKAKKIVFTGRIDEWFNECFGTLDYRSLAFEDELLDVNNFQGNAVVNYTEREIPYTRIIEHKHFVGSNEPYSVITKEFPKAWIRGQEPFYPINNERNNKLYEQYFALSKTTPEIIFGGRLGEYRYYDMDKVIEKALEAVEKEVFSFNE